MPHRKRLVSRVVPSYNSLSTMIIETQEEIEARQTLAETQPLLNRVVVEPFRLVDVSTTVDSYYDAFSNDPLHRYIGANPGPGRRPSTYLKAYIALLLVCWNWTKVLLTIDHGVAVLAASFPNRNTFLENVLARMLKIVTFPRRLIMPAEKKKRLAEVETKIKQVTKEAGVEGRLKDWVYLDLLFAARRSQGRGHGSALVKTLTDQLDLSGQTCWTHALALNEGFYNYHGFQTLASITIADDNPEWHEDAFVLHVMAREPKTTTDEKH
ncbi:hypothetical protein CPB83DRAFT_842849 [Crepidotus variabilis]|uniref:N-acetyltransferase domain-containing protein n=1 Tax=Crepidotus variabilis TaxID=179855 RepID=A0A9P6ETI2_9AGAR|nr:hypothetical protein CPB83DRAFT_842849 [Crepidotus variabilis]